jgi:hypothetical protein
MKHASNDDSKEGAPLFCPQRTIATAGTRTARCRSPSSPGLPPPMARRAPSSRCFPDDSNAADPTFLRDQLDLPLSPSRRDAVPDRACAITARVGLPPAHVCSATRTLSSFRASSRSPSRARPRANFLRRLTPSPSNKVGAIFICNKVGAISLLETESLTLVR